MKVYATGTSGMIGSRLKQCLPLRLDLLNLDSFRDVKLEPKSTLIHLAGIVGENKVKANESLARLINVEGTLQLARFIKDYTSCRMLFVSSSHVYAPSSMALKENDEVKPFSLYGQHKWEGEQACIRIFSDEPERLQIARVFSVLDIGMPVGTLGWAIENLSEERPLKNCDDERDFLTPGDVATLLYELTQRHSKFQIVNVCSGTFKSVGRACVDLRERVGKDTAKQLLHPGNSNNPKIIGDRSRLNRILSSVR
jgi:nucleoside-diphosphate-sugar epimerase